MKNSQQQDDDEWIKTLEDLLSQAKKSKEKKILTAQSKENKVTEALEKPFPSLQEQAEYFKEFKWHSRQNYHTEELIELIEHRKIDPKSEYGAQCLNLCASRNMGRVVGFLIRRGADVNWQNSEGESAFHLSCHKDYPGNIKFLIKNGAKIDVVNGEGRTPLNIAASYQAHSVARVLLINGADVNIKDVRGNTPLHIAAFYAGYYKEMKDNSATNSAKIVKLLLAKIGIKINEQNNKGETALHLACRFGAKDVVKPLIEEGADVNIKNHKGAIALVNTEDIESINSLIWAGSDINATDVYGMGILHKCSLYGKTETVKWLVKQKNIIIDLKNINGITPLYCALRQARMEVEVIQLLLEKGADVNFKQGEEGNTIFHLTSKIEIFEMALYYGADINSKNAQNETLLHKAVKQDRIGIALYKTEIVKWCLKQKNIIVDCLEKLKNTPLHLATINGDIEIVKMLLEKGADVNLVNGEGKTALDIVKHDVFDDDNWTVGREKILELLAHEAMILDIIGDVFDVGIFDN